MLQEDIKMNKIDEIKIKVIQERFGHLKFMPKKVSSEELDICIEKATEYAFQHKSKKENKK